MILNTFAVIGAHSADSIDDTASCILMMLQLDLVGGSYSICDLNIAYIRPT